MKKILAGIVALAALTMAGSAVAADMATPVYKAPPPLPVWDWTGFYVGIQGGGGWGRTEQSVTGVTICPGAGACGGLLPLVPAGTLQSSYGTDGWHAGGVVGFNWQYYHIVFGVEGEANWSDIDGTGACQTWVTATPFNNCHTRLRGFAMATGRLGLAVDHALIYVKGGGAWGRFDQQIFQTNANTCGPACPGCLTAAASVVNDRSGFVVGAGVEYGWRNWSVKLEYDMIDIGTGTIVFTQTGPLIDAVAGAANSRVNVFALDRERIHLVKAGLNYRFNWWAPAPVVTK